MRHLTTLAYAVPALLAIIALVMGYRDGQRYLRDQMDAVEDADATEWGGQW